ncbi:MAG: hypothetical protein EOO06_17545 [Chitinophagaceae bacterium]|nr:MAG: hypothetical protein EOO06_17545 [Chitinophagaceae bacterium]
MRNFTRSLCFCIALLTSHIVIAQSITITQPNGGEVLYPCQSYTIKWNQTGTPSNYWNIDYSIDGGTIWASVATNFLSSNGQFSWTVPNVTTTTALVRVYDAQNSATADQSNNVFSILKAVTLTAPNGGEVFVGNTLQNITWDAITGTSGFNVEYSINNGSSWNSIAFNLPAESRSYAWTVPVISGSTTCLVRIGYLSESCTRDQSDAVFTINPPTPRLTSPNGGQTFQPGCNYPITWSTSSLYTTARIDYSIDGGNSWNLIIDNASNSGNYNWSVPLSMPASTNCLIRICNTNRVNLFDVSNAPFSIGLPVTITTFNAGGTAVGCSSVPISITKSPCLGEWYVYYSIDNGATYTMFTILADNGLANQTFNWQVPNGINSSTAKIKIQSKNNSSIFDESDGNFTIQSSNDITVSSPNGGETLTGLTTSNITWTNLPAASGQYNVYYSINNGSSWTNLATNITGNSYSWAVPNINAASCRIKVEDYTNACKVDISDASFAIAPATPVLTSPNGGQVWQIGCAYNITWNTATIYNYVRLEYSIDNGNSWVQIVSAASNNGAYSWTVPSTFTSTTQCIFRISNYDMPLLYDISNGPVTFAIPVTVNSFNSGGATVIGCGSTTISFTKTVCLGSWAIYYSANNGSTWEIITVQSDNGLPTQTYTWNIPNDVTSSTAKIKVAASSNYSIADESDANFSIIPSNDITVTTPNGGETLTGLAPYNITWTNLPTASGQYTIRSYSWTPPNTTASTCLVRVIDYLNNCKYDVSDAVFNIIPATPVLTSPNATQTWQMGCAYNITWNSATLYTTARLDYSLDGGTTWNNIATAATNNGTYAWTVPAGYDCCAY